MESLLASGTAVSFLTPIPSHLPQSLLYLVFQTLRAQWADYSLPIISIEKQRTENHHVPFPPQRFNCVSLVCIELCQKEIRSLMLTEGRICESRKTRAKCTGNIGKWIRRVITVILLIATSLFAAGGIKGALIGHVSGIWLLITRSLLITIMQQSDVFRI